MIVKMQSTAFKCKPTLFQQLDLVVPITYGTACFVRFKIAGQINYLSFLFGNSRGRMGKAQHRDARLVPCSHMKAVGFGDDCNSEYQLQINRSWILSRAMPPADRAACPHPGGAVSTVGRCGVCPGWWERWLCSCAKHRHPPCVPRFCTHCSGTGPPAPSLCAGERRGRRRRRSFGCSQLFSLLNAFLLPTFVCMLY